MYRSGEVEVINPNQTSEPLFVQVTAKNSNLKNCGFTFPTATKPAQCDVTVSGEGVTMQSAEDGASQTGTKTYYAGTILTLSAPAPESGYCLAGWSINGGATQKLTNNKWTVNGDATVAPVYAKAYNITVNKERQGTASSSNTSVVSGETVTLTATVTNQDYYFAGWRKNTETAYESKQSTYTTPAITEDVTYTAVFKEKEWYLTVTSNDATLGSVSGGNKKCYDGEQVTLKATVANQFCNFVKWQNIL